MAKDKTDKSWFGRHKILTGLLIVIVLGIVASAAGGGSNQTQTGSNASESKPAATEEKAQQIAIGQAARDGKFEFTVNSIKCGETSVGTNQYLQQKAQGQFCRLNMAVSNIGDKAQSLFGDNQKLVDVSGKEYSYASTATLYAAPDSSSTTWFNEINPGNKVSGDIVFDIPAGVTPTEAILHDSAFSSGVKVKLQ